MGDEALKEEHGPDHMPHSRPTEGGGSEETLQWERPTNFAGRMVLGLKGPYAGPQAVPPLPRTFCKARSHGRLEGRKGDTRQREGFSTMHFVSVWPPGHGAASLERAWLEQMETTHRTGEIPEILSDTGEPCVYPEAG